MIIVQKNGGDMQKSIFLPTVALKMLSVHAHVESNL